MHASVWRYRGDLDGLPARYAAFSGGVRRV